MSSLGAQIYQRKPAGRPTNVPADTTTREPVAAPAVAKPKLDSETKAGTPIKAFTLSDMPEWGAWLLSRLQQTWPHLHEWSLRGRLAQMIMDNDILVLRTDHSVIAAELKQGPLDARPDIVVTFCFTRAEKADSDMIALYRSAEMWGKSKGAKQLLVRPVTDLIPSRFAEVFSERKQFYRDLD